MAQEIFIPSTLILVAVSCKNRKKQFPSPIEEPIKINKIKECFEWIDQKDTVQLEMVNNNTRSQEG